MCGGGSRCAAEDRPALRSDQIELVGVGPQTPTHIQLAECLHVGFVELEVEDVDVLLNTMGSHRLGDDDVADRMCQRRTTCAGVRPLLAAISTTRASSSRPRPWPRGPQDSVKIPCDW